jgi:hypothetical protein
MPQPFLIFLRPSFLYSMARREAVAPADPGHRTSERRFHQKITDIYATSIDYDPTQQESIEFFQTVQNKMHWAITGQASSR